MSEHDHRKGALMAAAGIVVLSPDGMLLRLIEQAGPWEIAFWRTLFIGLGVAALLAVQHGRDLGRVLGRLGRLGAAAVALQAAAQLGFVGAIMHTSVANTLVLLATMPLFSAIFGWLFLRERVAPRTVAAITAALAGIVVIFLGALGGGTLLGDGLALVTAALHGLNLVVLRRAGHGIIMPALCLSGFVAALAALPFADPGNASARDFGILAYFGLIQTPVAFALFFGGTRYIPAAEVALMSLIEAVLGPLWAWLAVGEVPPERSFIGGGIVLAAILGNSLLALRAGTRGRAAAPPPLAPVPARRDGTGGNGER